MDLLMVHYWVVMKAEKMVEMKVHRLVDSMEELKVVEKVEEWVV